MSWNIRRLPNVLVSALLLGACCFHGTGEATPQDDAGTEMDAGPMDAGFCVTDPPTSCAGVSLTLSPAPCDGGIYVLSEKVNEPWLLDLTAECGTPPYQWSVVANSGALPPGLSLTASGRLIGVPTQPGLWYFEVIVTDSAFASVNGHYELAVTPQ